MYCGFVKTMGKGFTSLELYLPYIEVVYGCVT